MIIWFGRFLVYLGMVMFVAIFGAGIFMALTGGF